MAKTIDFPAEKIGFFGWKYYNSIKKKAMEEESGWSGLLISLPIAFFIVLVASQALNLTYETISGAKNKEVVEKKIYPAPFRQFCQHSEYFLYQNKLTLPKRCGVYYLEDIKNINTEASGNINAKYLEINLNKQSV